MSRKETEKMRHKVVDHILDDFQRADEAVKFLLACGFTQLEITKLDLNLFGRIEHG